MNTILIAKNEILTKSNELQTVFGLSEEELFFAFQGAFLDLSLRTLSKSMYEDKAKQTQIERLTAKNTELCNILNERGIENGE